MNINVATWGRLLKRNTPSIQDNQPSHLDEQMTSGGSESYTSPAQPLQLEFEMSAEDFETVVAAGEKPDFSVAGLSGARPLG